MTLDITMMINSRVTSFKLAVIAIDVFLCLIKMFNRETNLPAVITELQYSMDLEQLMYSGAHAVVKY